jgi:F-type H+-transporting ATPase subunit b
MLIDWFTVGAQALNFLILVWLMKHFLYKPILNAIDAREKKIAAELADADAKKAEARKERDEFQHKNEEFERQRATLMSKATEDGQAERQRLLEAAGKAADGLAAARQEARQKEAHQLEESIRCRAQDEVFAITRKVLTDLATVSLEGQMAEVFSRQVRALHGQSKASLGEALKIASDPALVRSAFELPAGQRATIQDALNVTFSADIPLRYETAPHLVSGIELSANGRKVAWSISDYLAALEHGVDELLDSKDKPAREPGSAPADPKAAQT